MRNLKRKIISNLILARFAVYIAFFVRPKLKKLRETEARGEIPKHRKEIHDFIRKACAKAIKLAHINLSVKGVEKIPTDRPVLFISNHESYLDIPVLIHALKDFDFGFMIKNTMAELPLIDDLNKFLECVVVDQSNVRQALGAINNTVDKLKSGYSMLIFPEGRRSFSNLPLEFKNGAFKVARKAEAIIVPIYIHNVHLSYEGNYHCFGPADMTVTVFDPIDTAEMTKQEIDNLNVALQNKLLDYAKSYK